MSHPDNASTRRNRERARERYLSSLSVLVSGGLFVSTEPGEAERALMRVAGAMLKAVTVATFTASDGERLDESGWVAESSVLTRNEQHDALCGIVSLLQNGESVLGWLRDHEEFRESAELVTPDPEHEVAP